MISGIRKSDYAKVEPQKDSQNGQENLAETVVPAGVRRERNRETTAASGQN
jgi:hypothetical protein